MHGADETEFPRCAPSACHYCGAAHVPDQPGWSFVAVAMRRADMRAPVVLCPPCVMAVSQADADILARWLAARVLELLAESAGDLLAQWVQR